MYFAKILCSAVFKRNSGSEWRSAVATTNSEGAMPGRMVRNQEPKRPTPAWERWQTDMKQSLGDNAGVNKYMVGVDLALDGITVQHRNCII